MGRPRKAKKPVTLHDKVKEFDENLSSSVFTMTDDDLKSKMVTLAQEDEVIEKAYSDDGDIQIKKEELATMKETYTVPMKQNKLRKKLLLQVLSERGKL